MLFAIVCQCCLKFMLKLMMLCLINFKKNAYVLKVLEIKQMLNSISICFYVFLYKTNQLVVSCLKTILKILHTIEVSDKLPYSVPSFYFDHIFCGISR